MLETGTLQINFPKNVIENVLKERSADTLVLLQRQHDFKSPLKDVNVQGLPLLRLDETTVVPVKFVYNSQVIVVVSMSELADSMLLTVLAKDLNHMREARIIIWVQSDESTAMSFFDVIRDQASKHGFLNLMVLYLDPLKAQQGIVGYRLEPFPSSILVPIRDLTNGEMFPDFHRNFHNKTANFIPRLYTPDSYVSQDRKSGKLKLSGHTDMLMSEFARKRNINLKMIRPIAELNRVTSTELLQLISNGGADLTTFTSVCDSIQCTDSVEFMQVFIVIPCGQEVGIGDVYKSLKNFLAMILLVYLIISIVTTLIEAASCRIYSRRYRFSYRDLIVNLNAFRWVLGLSSDVQINRRNRSLHQIIMVMSIFSMIVVCFFDANLSTFLTKRQQIDNIKTFKELKESGIRIIFDNVRQEHVLTDIRKSFLRISENQIDFVSTEEFMRMLMGLNTSNAYQVFDKLWDVVNKYQSDYKIVVLCRSSGLNIFGLLPNRLALPNNSIYLRALNDFIHMTHDFGLTNYWRRTSINNLIAFSNSPAVLSASSLLVK
ncbi:uncharacterized protein LOC117574398 [Drosophila albomicans]|uniref:Uncharacterized protein LOC117574398 n=1 Tax=Drosophila albomicans TaxID=7291 RepID=A0A6P8XME0_DROAB|nr:uncharacterized protein LOC117574398 [Drosophila albomicans]